jgi:hypothetical protein
MENLFIIEKPGSYAIPSCFDLLISGEQNNMSVKSINYKDWSCKSPVFTGETVHGSLLTRETHCFSIVF